MTRFLSVAERHGERVAVRTRTGDTTFAELAVLTRRFAAEFAAIPSPKVLVAYEQGPYAYAAMLGAMLAGGYYVPIAAAAPREKMAAICAAFEPAILVGEDALLEEFPTSCAALRLPKARIDAAVPSVGTGVRHAIAYVIFTSGSTGAPKGVVISHAALAHYVGWVSDSGLFQAGDRVSQYTNIAFDVSVLDIFCALCAGATLVPFTSRGDKYLPAESIQEHAITVWVSVPSVVSLMMRAKQLTHANVKSVRRFFFVGEPLLETHVTAIFAANPGAEIWNAYGPTETTVTMTCLKLTADDYATAVSTSVALGKPIPGMQIHLLGGESAEAGELVIVGPQLAEGYWNDLPQTAQAFRTLELGGVRQRAYFSGDAARIIEGQLYFQGRLDQQVKIDGFRVELNEVAAAIRSLGWADVVVLKINGDLTAILENKTGAAIALLEKKLRADLRQKLEPYAIPSRYLSVKEFPRNQNDKIDLQALAKIAQAQR